MFVYHPRLRDGRRRVPALGLELGELASAEAHKTPDGPRRWHERGAGVSSMSWRRRGSILGVLVLTNCCSVALVPAPFEEHSVSSAQRSAGVSEARTTATPLLSSSLTSPCLVPHGPRPSFRRLAAYLGAGVDVAVVFFSVFLNVYMDELYTLRALVPSGRSPTWRCSHLRPAPIRYSSYLGEA